MSEIILIVTFTVVFAVLQVALIISARKNRRLSESECRTVGTVGKVKEVTMQRELMYSFPVEYTVNGRTYVNKLNYARIDRVKEGQQVTVRYLETKPSVSVVEDTMDHHEVIGIDNRRIVAAELIIIFAIALFMLFFVFDLRDIFEMLEIPILVSPGIIKYIEELNLRSGTSETVGSVMRASESDKGQTVIAEYTVDGQKYLTREMKIPKKYKDKYVNTGAPAEVKYKPQKPHKAIIADDTYSLRKAKIMFIAACVLICLNVVVMILLSLPGTEKVLNSPYFMAAFVVAASLAIFIFVLVYTVIAAKKLPSAIKRKEKKKRAIAIWTLIMILMTAALILTGRLLVKALVLLYMTFH